MIFEPNLAPQSTVILFTKVEEKTRRSLCSVVLSATVFLHALQYWSRQKNQWKQMKFSEFHEKY
jgi:hypothetical protein